MAFKCGLPFIYIYIIVGVISLDGVFCGLFDKPQIMYDSEHTVETNDNFTLFCQGNKELNWTWPILDESDKISWTTFETVSEQPTNSNYRYGLRLNIRNMTYPYVGYYYCHYKDADLNSTTESTNVYLYVNDEEHLSTLDCCPRIIATRNELVTIPCRPTQPDVTVEIYKNDGQILYVDGYDSHIGFITNETDGEYLNCTFRRNSLRSSILVFFEIETPVSYLPKPVMKEISDGHTVVGDTLSLICNIASVNTVKFDWMTPIGGFDKSRMSNNNSKDSNYAVSRLDIYNAQLSDSGLYTCHVSDLQNHRTSENISIKIFDTNESYIIAKESNKIYSALVSAGTELIQWAPYVEGHPKPNVTWLNNKNETISMGENEKYYAYYNETTRQVLLRIKNIQITDFGNYTLVARNRYNFTQLNFFLNVTDKPTVDITTDPFHMFGRESVVKCIAVAYPEPQFNWEYKACPDCDFEPINGSVIDKDGLQVTSEVKILANDTGAIKCRATNSNGFDEEISRFVVTDVSNGFDVFGFDDEIILNENKDRVEIAIGETTSFTCGASSEVFDGVSWMFQGKPFNNTDGHNVIYNQTYFSNKAILELHNVKYSDEGIYSCQAEKDGNLLFKNISISVENPMYPEIIETNMKGHTTEINFPERFLFVCKVKGLPKPKISWFKNGQPFSSSEKRIFISNDKTLLHFIKTDIKDEATYKCEAENKLGTIEMEQTLKFKNVPRYLWLILVIAILSVLFVVAVIFIILRMRKEKALQRKLKKLGLANFERGAIESINPDLGVDDQAELLPYDKKWEFPIERLKLGKQLGSGAFGVVMKGEAKNIVEGEPITTVAVKMVKKNADNTYIRALVSELKIMVHLGKHLNVVNLLGACTKNVANRELLVIVEYCRYGNLQNYLLRHRDNFVNQIDPESGKLDYNIGQEYLHLDRSYSVSSDRSNCQSPSLKYAALTFSNNSNNSMVPTVNVMGDYRANPDSGISAKTQMTTAPQDDGITLSNNSVQPEWRSNYKGDYKGSVKPICTKDLLAWAFQVARGMEYLASRKVLHGDLAARNILLTDNNIVKICDFGLAKSMYKNDNYTKRGNCLLPVKWMAIESISDRVFSTQSDVWSFGVVLWELFSLGRTPYPGMDINERLYHKLVEGYRMEAPEYSPREIYQLMTECWSAKPLLRPTFTNLSEKLGNLLEDILRKHYVDLNDPYLAMNTKRLENGHSDYLAMLSPPTYEATTSPHYENDIIIQSPSAESGYMSMQASTIFSPRAIQGDVFDFNVNQRKHLNSEDGQGTELLPMLHPHHESDSETPIQSPNTLNSVSNPFYHHLPSELERRTHNENIVKSLENYVNMRENKNILNAKQLEGNSFTEIDSLKAPHYVNNNPEDCKTVNG